MVKYLHTMIRITDPGLPRSTDCGPAIAGGTQPNSRHTYDALVYIEGLDTPIGPGTTLAAVTIADCVKVRTAQLLVERGAMPPAITRACASSPATP